MLLLNLPAELVLSIVELAAWDEVDSDRTWVAGLCLVCKIFRTAATGPLYDTIHIYYDNFDRAIWTASLKDTPFLRTRRVTISLYPAGQAHVLEGHFARAFANVEYLAASSDMLHSLVEHGQRMRCAMVFMSDRIPDEAECDALRPLLDACTHIHVVLHLGHESDPTAGLPGLRRLLGPRPTRVIVDPVVWSEDLPVETLAQAVDMLLGLPCTRVLFRTLDIRQNLVRQFCTLVGGIACDRRDARLWIDNSAGHPNRTIFERDHDDGKRGWALWEAGKPLYAPEDSRHTQDLLVRDA